MSSSYNFKDNLTIDNNKYLKWLDVTGTSRSNVICLDNNNNVNINSLFGNIYIKPESNYTLIDSNALFNNNIGVGFFSTSEINSAVSIKSNDFISSSNNTGYLGITGDTNLSETSRIILYGSNNIDNPSKLQLYAGNNANGVIQMYTGLNSLKFQILQNGTSSFMPNGSTSRLIIEDELITATNNIFITSSAQSYNSSTGCLRLEGGIGIKGNLFVDGTININSVTGNINFDSSQTSTSYTTGAIFLSGGLGISTSVNATSPSAGGAISIAGGAAIGKDTYIGGKLIVSSTEIPISSQTGSFVLHGGMGINGPIFSRSDNTPQVNMSPVTNGGETSIVFYYNNNFSNTTNSSWKIGQNINESNGSFSIYNSNLNHIFTSTSNGNIGFFCSNPTNTLQLGSGNRFSISSNQNGMSIIGTKETSDQNDPENTRIVINGNTNLNSAGSIQYFSSGGDHTWYANSNTLLSLHSSGNLTINGDANIQNSLYIEGPILQIPTGTTLSRQSNPESGQIRYNIDTSQFEGYGPGSAWGSLGGVVDIAQTTKILASSSPSITDGNLYFYTVGSERMRINSSGNIGIGTSTPSYKLDIVGDIYASVGITTESFFVSGQKLCVPTGNISSRPTNPQDGLIRYNIETNQFEGYGPGSAWGSLGGVVDIAQTTKILASSSPSITDGNLYFYTVGSERMRINSSGNIGIGTSSPSYTLDIVGDTHISNYFNATYDTNTLGNLYTYDYKVGINTVTPNYTLDVNGDTHIAANLYIDGIITASGQTSTSLAYITVTSSDAAENFSSGSIISFGGITLQNPDDATSITNGGSILTKGGASIGKNLFVGKNVFIESSDNATGLGTGGSLTILGGGSFGKDVFIGGTVTSSSDIRLKKDIEPFKKKDDVFLNKVVKLQTIKYNYINNEINNPDTKHVGFIAQELVDDFPELLKCPKDGFYSLDYQKMSVVLVECLKELKERVDYLEEYIIHL
jgi:hypothetical protein